MKITFTRSFLLCVLLSFACTLSVYSQKFSSGKKASLIGFSVNFTDFNTPQNIQNSSLGDVLKNGEWGKLNDMSPGLSLMYWKGLSNRIDLSGRYNLGFSDYSKSSYSSDLMHEFEGAFHLRALTDDHLFNPFLTAGIGIGEYGNSWAPYSPLGVGLQVNLRSLTYIFLQGNYRLSYDKSAVDNSMFYSLGITESLTKPKSQPPLKQVPIPVVEKKDADNDGVEDSLDACPDVAGLARFNGCPDKDGDGVIDKDDKCPDVKGLERYQGCPIPDGDGDGVNDEEDKCPDEKGFARYQGCPIPDGDGDGINDEEDKCPTVAGIAANSGCPEIKQEIVKKVTYSAQHLFFATGSYKLLSKSFTSLDAVAKILQEDENLKLTIEGHTDITGNADKNQVLSEQRAKSVASYLESKGIGADRLIAVGHGQTQPIASNKTAAGRTKNRRVDLKLGY